MTPSELLTNDMLSVQGLYLLGLPIFLVCYGIAGLVKRWRGR